jgi:hypothetical protein
VSFPHSPGFAVILNGAWGIGKTYLLKRFLEDQRKLGKKCVYVSLYGLDTLDEIDNALLRSIYPLLAMKGTRIAGRVATSISERFGLGALVKELDPKEILDRLGADLYAFDDLERCEAPLNKVLGYINEFVEHDGCKVVIVANEAEIRNTDKEDYLRRREKLIGKTLQVQSEFGKAFDYFRREEVATPPGDSAGA